MAKPVGDDKKGSPSPKAKSGWVGSQGKRREAKFGRRMYGELVDKGTLCFRKKFKLSDIGLSREDREAVYMIGNFEHSEIDKFVRMFSRLDTNRDGIVATDKLLQLPRLQFNPLRARIVTVFKRKLQGKSQINFLEFISVLNVFTPHASITDKIRFTFEMYDMDDDGKLSKDDLRKMFALVFGARNPGEEITRLTGHSRKTKIECDVRNGKEAWCLYADEHEDYEKQMAELKIKDDMAERRKPVHLRKNLIANATVHDIIEEMVRSTWAEANNST